MTTPPKPDHEKRPFRFKLEGPFLRVSTMLLITPISPNFKGLKCSVFGRFRALQSRNIYGEICLAGPTVMMGYLHHPEETAATLQTHADGLTWVHTGDLGYMDSDGFVYFKQRIKRMIVTSGYNVYPSQMENILDAHELVQMSCVIGVPDKLKMQKVKAFVMLKPGVPANEETRDVLMAYLKKNVAKYAMPYDIEFRAELPKTLVGKVAYRVLEEEELKKLAAAADPTEAKAE